MAVNLLALANQMRGNFQDGSSGSRTRTSYQNQPGNLKRGTHIPGTNLKEDQGIRTIARKGRKGDSKLRKVDGEIAHVNTAEAKAIDTLGPMGEAWVKNVGSGTINPKTGLREYGFWGNVKKIGATAVGFMVGGVPGALQANAWASGTGGGVWKPSEGKWGIYGRTDASAARDRAKEQARTRKNAFSTFFDNWENENIAGIFTEDEEDDTPLVKSLANNSKGQTGLTEMITDNSGLNYPAVPDADFTKDILNYTDPYDTRFEDEAGETLIRDKKQAALAKKSRGAGLQTLSKDVGAGTSSSLFGMLTTSADTTAQQGFAGSGDFGAEFQKNEVIEEAKRKVKEGGETSRMEQESADLGLKQVIADAASAVKSKQEDYNQQFWTDMGIWESAINS